MIAQHRKSGLTIIEIILALAILGGVMAILGEVGRRGLQNAISARDITQAELICESLLGMVRIGLIPLENAFEVPLENDYPDTNAVMSSNVRGEPLWYYSVEINSTNEDGLLEVAITVRQNDPNNTKPLTCRMIRWMIDPVFLEDMETEMEEILNPESTETATTGV